MAVTPAPVGELAPAPSPYPALPATDTLHPGNVVSAVGAIIGFLGVLASRFESALAGQPLPAPVTTVGQDVAAGLEVAESAATLVPGVAGNPITVTAEAVANAFGPTIADLFVQKFGGSKT